MTSRLEFIELCRQELEKSWTEILESENKEVLLVTEPLKGLIKDCINSETKSYRYVLPTQLLAKLIDSSLDSRSLQAASSLIGSFDARSLCHKVVVPFDKMNEDVLGGSPEPYVNNPLRVRAITEEHIGQQRNPEGWRKLCSILKDVEETNDQEFTRKVFNQVLLEVYHRFSSIRVAYPMPMRISLDSTIKLINDFLDCSSGGEHPVVITYSILKTIGERFGLYDDVKREKINASDSSTGMISDIQCILSGDIILSIEVKDKELTIEQAKAKLKDARTQQVANLLFIVQKGVSNKEEFESFIKQEFSSGQNIYIFNILDFVPPILVLFSESDRIKFLNNICETLDEFSEVTSRQKWARLLFEN
jgi:hypothetical protein